MKFHIFLEKPTNVSFKNNYCFNFEHCKSPFLPSWSTCRISPNVILLHCLSVMSPIVHGPLKDAAGFFVFYRLHDQMIKMNQSLHRLQVAWREAQQSSNPAADNLREQFERLMTIYLSTKAAATEPQMLQNCMNLQISTTTILVQFSLGNRGTEYMEVKFPLLDVEYCMLSHIPGI